MTGACKMAGLLLVLSCAIQSPASEAHFTEDPNWDGFRNRLLPGALPRSRQDFGHRASHHAGGRRAGEVGGWIQRSITAASYAKAIEPRTLKHRLSASGRFAVTNDAGFSGVMLGWFHEKSRGWRTPNSMAIRLDGNGGRYWVFFEYGTRNWLTGGAGTFEGEYQTTKTKPYLADGTPHDWSLTYDPDGANGNGEIVLVLDGRSHAVALAPGHKQDGAEFNRFGLWNVHVSGSGMEVYLDDLVLDGLPEDFSADPGWVGTGNKADFAERCVRPLHDFGYSGTAHAGGAPGEVGGLIWRDEAPAYYAAKVGNLSLTNQLHAFGKLAFLAAGSDSAVYLGWFNAASKTNKNTPHHLEPQRNFLAILIEGPSQVGHYFRPVYANAEGIGAMKESGPLIKPDGRVHNWSLRYHPSPSGGGEIIVMLDDSLQRFPVRSDHQDVGATFDRFGFFNLQRGGHFVEVYADDLAFTR